MEWFASWAFKSDEEVEALQQRLQAMSAMVHTAVQRSSVFLAFLQPNCLENRCLPSVPSSPSACKGSASALPRGQELADLAQKELERSRSYLERSSASLSTDIPI